MNPAVSAKSAADAVSRRRPRWPWVFTAFTVLLLIAGAIYYFKIASMGSRLGYYGQWVGSNAPAFALTNQNGGTTNLSDLHGKVVLMTFGFTHCPNVCPTTLANLAAITRGLPASEQSRVQVAFITVDPQRDNAKALKDYVGFYSPQFIGLTGTPDQIAKVAKDYGAFFESQLQDSQVTGDYYTVNHSAYIYLIDPAGRYALLYDNDKLADHAKMTADIERMLSAPAQ